jgi:hypothetical protein
MEEILRIFSGLILLGETGWNGQMDGYSAVTLELVTSQCDNM